jgi:hypothetical protein
MNRTAIAKRAGGAVLLIGLAVAAYFLLKFPISWFATNFDRSAANALSVVGVKATADAAGDFMAFGLFALWLVFGATSRLSVKKASGK